MGKKEEFEEELLNIERALSNDLDRSRSGPRGDIRDRLDMGKNGKLDDSLESNDIDDDAGFMTDRRVVETDGETRVETNGGREEGDDVDRKSVMSRVVKEVKSREETIEEQKTDNKVVARNKRMFGALVGTLQKFNKEEIKKKDVTEKKKVVELKVEERTEKEKEEIKNRKRELFSEQKKKKKDILIIQKQMK